MRERLLKVLPLSVVGLLTAILTAGFSPAQDPIPLFQPNQPAPVPRLPAGDPEPLPLPLPTPAQPVKPTQPQPAQGDGIDVLAKGPVHEAFAATAEAPAASPVVKKQPPEPIEELPPEQKPEGDNVQWIPGYWHWDDETERFIWISGFWRQVPPGRVWVPGSWRVAGGGSQWVPGFWQEVNPVPQPNQPQQVQPQIEYLPEPPATIEVGPTVAAPGESYFYVPGSWVWRGRYVWRPGVWVQHRADWVWVPARYYWTPAGYVFCEGYWDYPLATRGVLFAPVAFARPIYAQPAFVYTPVYVVSEPCMVGALFVRRGHSHYYFGDYFGPTYVSGGYSAWCGTYTRNGFSIGFGVGRTWGYDPLWSYYSVTYRSSPAWYRGVGDLYHGRYRGDVTRPPTTLVQQNTVINNVTNVNVTNVTNNIKVVNGRPTVNNRDVSSVAMVAPLSAAPDLQKTKFQAVNAEARRSEATAARQIREVGAQRTKLETAVAQQPAVGANRPPVGRPAAPVRPQSITLDVPKSAVARAQVSDEKKAPPPNPLRSANDRPGAKADGPRAEPKAPGGPRIDPPRIDPKQPGNPKFDRPRNDPPKVEPQPLSPRPKAEPPRGDPRPFTPGPRSEPKQPGNPLPKVEPQPQPLPRVDPKPQPLNPPVAPKAELPRPPGNPLPGVDPKAPVLPKGDVPRFDPRRPGPAPKVEPKQPGKPQPRENPRPVEQAKPLAAVPLQQPKLPAINPQPVPQYKPPVAAAPVQRPVQPPRVVAPPVQQPRAASHLPAQARPTPSAPANPPRVVQPPRAQPAKPQPKPGKERGKGKDD